MNAKEFLRNKGLNIDDGLKHDIVMELHTSVLIQWMEEYAKSCITEVSEGDWDKLVNRISYNLNFRKSRVKEIMPVIKKWIQDKLTN